MKKARNKSQPRKRITRAGRYTVVYDDPRADPRKTQRGFKLEGHSVQEMHPRIVNVSFDVTQEVAAALRALRDTGLFGNGVDCASIAEELLRKALLDPQVLPYWQNAGRFICHSCGHTRAIWAPRCPSCLSIGLELRTKKRTSL